METPTYYYILLLEIETSTYYDIIILELETPISYCIIIIEIEACILRSTADALRVANLSTRGFLHARALMYAKGSCLTSGSTTGA